jgi:hypothetical protein
MLSVKFIEEFSIVNTKIHFILVAQSFDTSYTRVQAVNLNRNVKFILSYDAV